MLSWCQLQARRFPECTHKLTHTKMSTSLLDGTGQSILNSAASSNADEPRLLSPSTNHVCDIPLIFVLSLPDSAQNTSLPIQFPRPPSPMHSPRKSASPVKHSQTSSTSNVVKAFPSSSMTERAGSSTQQPSSLLVCLELNALGFANNVIPGFVTSTSTVVSDVTCESTRSCSTRSDRSVRTKQHFA